MPDMDFPTLRNGGEPRDSEEKAVELIENAGFSVIEVRDILL
jgi:hypothetical protein